MFALILLGYVTVLGLFVAFMVNKKKNAPVQQIEPSFKEKHCALMLQTARSEIAVYGKIMSGSVNNHLMNCGCVSIQKISSPEPPPLKPDFDILEPQHYGTKGMRYGLDALLTPNESRMVNERGRLLNDAIKAMKEYRGDG